VSGFMGSGIVPESSTWVDQKSATIQATATMSLTLPSPINQVTAQEQGRLQRIGFKIGLLIEDGQVVEELTASGVTAVELPAIGADLTSVFGAAAGRHWMGFYFPSPPPVDSPAPNVALYHLTLRLTNALNLPQSIHAPSRYATEASFAVSHLDALWVLMPPRP
jgi:hypothetical protein